MWLLMMPCETMEEEVASSLVVVEIQWVVANQLAFALSVMNVLTPGNDVGYD